MGAVADGSYEKFGYGTKPGQTDLAAINRMNNPWGSHTFLGSILSTALPNILSGGADMLSSKINDSGEKSYEVEVVTGSIADFSSLLKRYEKASGNERLRLRKEIEAYAEKYPKNPTIQTSYYKIKTSWT